MGLLLRDKDSIPEETRKMIKKVQYSQILDKHPNRCLKQEKSQSKSQDERERLRSAENTAQRNIQCTVDTQNVFN